MKRPFEIIDLQQGTQEWLDFRKGKVGASMAPAIKKVSPFQTYLELWEEIVLDKKKKKTAAMEKGNELEDKARQWLNAKLGLNFEPKVLQSTFNPRIIASLDAYVETELGVMIGEIKCPGIDGHLQAIEGKIPHYYYPQLQHQMHVAGVDNALYVSFNGENGVFLVCMRDQAYIDDLIKEEEVFLASIDVKIPPEPSDRDWVELNDSRANEVANRRKQLKSLIAQHENELEEVDKELMGMIVHPRTKINGLKIQKVFRKGSIDYERLLKKYNIKDVESYRNDPSESWRITSSS